MPIVHENIEGAGGTLTYGEWNGGHSISANSLGLGGSTLYFASTEFYAVSDVITFANNIEVLGNLVVGGTMTSSGAFDSTGLATLLPGSTDVAFAHGYGGSPNMVVLSPTTDTGGKRVWHNKDATNVTINIDSAYSSTIIFEWGTV